MEAAAAGMLACPYWVLQGQINQILHTSLVNKRGEKERKKESKKVFFIYLILNGMELLF